MTISPFDLILLLGSVQGVILALLLWFNPKGGRLSNRLLAVLIGLLASMSFAVGVPVANRWVGLMLELIPLIVAMPIGPLVYFYTRSMLDSTVQIGPAERRHFYPVILDVGAQLVGWTFIIGLLLGFWEQKIGPSFGRVMDEYNTYVDIPRWISATVYLFLTKRLLDTQPVPNQQTDSGKQRLNWLRQFVNAFLVFQTIWLLFMIPYIAPDLRGPLLDKLGWYPIYIPITFLIYWLGLKGYLHSRSTAAAQLSPKPAGTELPEATVSQVVSALTTAMATDQLFLDPDLTVDKLGQQLQLPPKLISAVVNQHLHKNFNSFVNEYRVDAVKGRLTDPAYEHLTLTGIAFDCGFNSQATFQRTFKQLTGTSPGEYAAQRKKNSSQIRI